MEIILSTRTLAAPGGSETYILGLARGLQKLGHTVILHTVEDRNGLRLPGAIGLLHCGQESDLPPAPDCILSQDGIVAYRLRELFPRTPQIFVCHSATHDLQLPPQLPDVVHKVVVLNDRVGDRVRATSIDPDMVVRLRQPIDISVFDPQYEISSRPKRLLLFSNRLPLSRQYMVERVCAAFNVEVTVGGGASGSVTHDPRSLMLEADIVMAYGRSLLESMACGRAAYVYDYAGGDGWVTRGTYEALEADGFGGRAGLGPIDYERLSQDLANYSPRMGAVNRDLVVAGHDMSQHAQQIAAIMRTTQSSAGSPTQPLQELSRLVRYQWMTEAEKLQAASEAARFQQLYKRSESQLEQVMLRLEEVMRRCQELESELAASAAVSDVLNAQLTDVLTSRRYRVAKHLARAVEYARHPLIPISAALRACRRFKAEPK